MEFTYTITLDFSPRDIFSCLCNIRTLFALNPQWEVKSIDGFEDIHEGCSFDMAVKYDRSEEEAAFKVSVPECISEQTLLINFESISPNPELSRSRHMTFSLQPRDTQTLIEYKETRDQEFTFEEKRELMLWLKSIGNYLLICRRRTPWGRLWRFFVDRFWLRMSPAGRRLVFMVIFFEGLTLLLLVVFIVFKLIVG